MATQNIRWFDSEQQARNYCTVDGKQRLVICKGLTPDIKWGGATLKQLFDFISLTPFNERTIRISCVQSTEWKSRLYCSVVIPSSFRESVNDKERIAAVIRCLHDCLPLYNEEYFILQDMNNDDGRYTIIFPKFVVPDHLCNKMLITQAANNQLAITQQNEDEKLCMPASLYTGDNCMQSIINTHTDRRKETIPCWSCKVNMFDLELEYSPNHVQPFSEFVDRFPFVPRSTACTMDENQCIRMVAKHAAKLIAHTNAHTKNSDGGGCNVM